MTGKPVKKVSKRRQTEIKKERILLIKEALELGITTRSGLCKAAGCKMYDLANIFQTNDKLYRQYKIRRKNLAEIAADNIEDIINDAEHPNNYAASKWVVDKYKSDLDKSLESQDSDEIALEIGKGSKDSIPVVISFSKKSKGKEEE